MIRWAFRIVTVLAALVVVYVGVTFVQVWWASRSNDTSPASAIVVMGAAQWNGKPSPVLQGRLDHAVVALRGRGGPADRGDGRQAGR